MITLYEILMLSKMQHAFKKQILILLTLAVALSACSSDPTASNDSNFRKVIDAYLVSHPACTKENVLIPVTMIDSPPKFYHHMTLNGTIIANTIPINGIPPADLEGTHETLIGNDDLKEGLRKKLLALDEAGLLNTSTQKYHHLADPAQIQPEWTETDRTYTINPSDATILKKGSTPASLFQQDSGPNWGSLCFSTKKVDSIVNYTEPADNPLAGGIATTVRYTYSIGDIADWAKRPAIQNVFPSIQKTIDESKKTRQETVLRKISTGWEVIL